MSVVPAMVAERLGRPQLTFANKVDIDGDAISIQRQTDYGYDKVSASLPALVSVVEKINEPRYPSFKGIMAAKKKPVETLTLSDVGVDASEVGLGGHGARWRVSLPARRGRQAPSSRTRVTARQSWRTSWPPKSSSSSTRTPFANVGTTKGHCTCQRSSFSSSMTAVTSRRSPTSC